MKTTLRTGLCLLGILLNCVAVPAAEPLFRNLQRTQPTAPKALGLLSVAASNAAPTASETEATGTTDKTWLTSLKPGETILLNVDTVKTAAPGVITTRETNFFGGISIQGYLKGQPGSHFILSLDPASGHLSGSVFASREGTYYSIDTANGLQTIGVAAGDMGCGLCKDPGHAVQLQRPASTNLTRSKLPRAVSQDSVTISKAAVATSSTDPIYDTKLPEVPNRTFTVKVGVYISGTATFKAYTGMPGYTDEIIRNQTAKIMADLDITIREAQIALDNSKTSIKLEVVILDQNIDIYRSWADTADKQLVAFWSYYAQGGLGGYQPCDAVMAIGDNTTDPDTRGIAFQKTSLFEPYPDDQYRAGWIHKNALKSGRYTFVHELGHIFGANHEKENVYLPGLQQPHAFGFGYRFAVTNMEWYDDVYYYANGGDVGWRTNTVWTNVVRHYHTVMAYGEVTHTNDIWGVSRPVFTNGVHIPSVRLPYFSGTNTWSGFPLTDLTLPEGERPNNALSIHLGGAIVSRIGYDNPAPIAYSATFRGEAISTGSLAVDYDDTKDDVFAFSATKDPWDTKVWTSNRVEVYTLIPNGNGGFNRGETLVDTVTSVSGDTTALSVLLPKGLLKEGSTSTNLQVNLWAYYNERPDTDAFQGHSGLGVTLTYTRRTALANYDSVISLGAETANLKVWPTSGRLVNTLGEWKDYEFIPWQPIMLPNPYQNNEIQAWKISTIQFSPNGNMYASLTLDPAHQRIQGVVTYTNSTFKEFETTYLNLMPSSLFVEITPEGQMTTIATNGMGSINGVGVTSSLTQYTFQPKQTNFSLSIGAPNALGIIPIARRDFKRFGGFASGKSSSTETLQTNYCLQSWTTAGLVTLVDNLNAASGIPATNWTAVAVSGDFTYVLKAIDRGTNVVVAYHPWFNTWTVLKRTTSTPYYTMVGFDEYLEPIFQTGTLTFAIVGDGTTYPATDPRKTVDYNYQANQTTPATATGNWITEGPYAGMLLTSDSEGSQLVVPPTVLKMPTTTKPTFTIVMDMPVDDMVRPIRVELQIATWHDGTTTLEVSEDLVHWTPVKAVYARSGIQTVEDVFDGVSPRRFWRTSFRRVQ